MEEIWKDITGYEGLYQVSNLGRIKSLDKLMLVYGFHKTPIQAIRKGKILSPRKNSDGYEKVSLTKDNVSKQYFVHRLVAICFIDNVNGYEEVNHIDGNKTNNNITNLEWCTHLENMQHCYVNNLRKKSTTHYGLKYGNSPNAKKVYQYDLNMNFITSGSSISEAAEFIGVDSSNISRCCSGETKTCKGFIWRTTFQKELEESCGRKEKK